MNKFFQLLEKHAKIVLACILVLTLFFLYEAQGLHLNADYGAFIPWGETPNTYQGGISGQDATVATVSLEDYDGQSITLDTQVFPSSYLRAALVPSFEEIPIQTEPDYPKHTNYLVMVESDNLFTPEVLTTLEYCIQKLAATRELGEPFSVLDFVTLDKKGTRLLTVPMSPHKGNEPWREDEATLLKSRIDNDPIVPYYLVGGDRNSILFEFGVSNVGQDKLNEFSEMLQPLRDMGIQVYTNGGAVINAKVFEYLQKDLITLVALCLLVILIVYYLCFKSKRSVLIPLSMSIIGIIWTFGTMKLMGLSLTILNIVTPCMVLTLGSAYSIHVLSEYYASFQMDINVSPIQSTQKILKTILLACMTTIAGFLCLTISKTQGLKEFGVAVSIGVAYCAFLACTYLPALLSLSPPPKTKQIHRYETGIMARGIQKLSHFVVKYWVVLLCLLVVLACTFVFVKDKISMDSNYMSYFPESDPFGQESRHFAAQMGGTNPFQITITAPDGSDKGFFLDSDNLAKVWNYEQIIKASPDVLQIISFPAYVSFANETMSGTAGIPESNALMNLLSRLIILLKNQVGSSLSLILNEDATEITLIMQHWDSYEKDLMTTSSISRINSLLVEHLDMLPAGTTVTIGGDPIPNLKFSNRLLADQNTSTILSLIVVLIITCIAFKSLGKGLLTIIPVLCGIMINYVCMFIFSIPFDMVTVSFSSIAIGCGVDDAIHFMLRYSQTRKRNPNESVEQLIQETIVQVGRPIILTTASIVLGMLMLCFASYTPIRYFGLLMSISLSGCMLATLLFLPPAILFFAKVKQIIRRKK